jgi:hypothetical protein
METEMLSLAAIVAADKNGTLVRVFRLPTRNVLDDLSMVVRSDHRQLSIKLSSSRVNARHQR